MKNLENVKEDNRNKTMDRTHVKIRNCIQWNKYNYYNRLIWKKPIKLLNFQINQISLIIKFDIDLTVRETLMLTRIYS